MPLYDFLCRDCGVMNEILVASLEEIPRCRACGGSNMKKMLSAHSSLSGAPKNSFPGAGDTACCGSSPTDASCAGPGSCCGRNPSMLPR